MDCIDCKYYHHAWKMMENSDSIFMFLNIIGAILGPVAGVMIVKFFFISKCRINIEELYFDRNSNERPKVRINIQAYIATIVGVSISLIGFIPKFHVILDFSWFIGFFTAGILLLLLNIFKK